MKKAKKTKRNPPAKQVRAMRERPKMPPISEEMKQWSVMLKAEVSGWPQLSTKPMFGMMGLYRGKKIFGGLPVTRGFDTPNSVIFRFDPMPPDRKSTRLNSSNPSTSYAVFCLKKKKIT